MEGRREGAFSHSWWPSYGEITLYPLCRISSKPARAPSKIQKVERNEHLEWLKMHRPPICLNLLEAAQSICRSTYSFESFGNGPRNKRANKDWSDAIYLLDCSREEREEIPFPSFLSFPSCRLLFPLYCQCQIGPQRDAFCLTAARLTWRQRRVARRYKDGAAWSDH